MNIDSSFFLSVGHNRYGKLKNIPVHDSTVFKIKENFYQVGLSSLKVRNVKLPWSGGFYFRFIPYFLFKMGIKNILNQNDVFVFYIHPWEFDPDQPRVSNIKMNYKLRHYLNLDKTAENFKKLLADFNFCPIREIITLADNNINHSKSE